MKCKLYYIILIVLILSGASFKFYAENLLVNEDFSSPQWEAEFLRLNPDVYKTPAIGGANAFNLNINALYFNKYKLSGAVETLEVLPCPLGDEYLHQNTSPVEITFADPTIYAENGKFYLSGTRPGSPAGFILLESSNLTDWQLSTTDPTGMLLKKGDGSYGESGFWAPQILKDNLKYYMTYTASEHIAIAISSTLNGKYTQSTLGAIDPDDKNIDSFLFKDEDGKYYLYHVRFNKGNYLWVAEFNMTTGKINKATLRQCLDNTEPWEATPAYTSSPIMEGPTVFKKNGVYYLFYSANHFQSIDYAVGYATATSPMGPWTKYENNPIIHRSIVNENGSGHGDLFFDEHGVPYYVYHVHQNSTTVAPRKTRIAPLSFNFNPVTNRYDISVIASGIIIPKVRSSNNKDYAAIESAFTGTQKAVAFRLNNNPTGMIEFPELPNAGEITLHIRNGNQGSPTNVALEQLVNGNWQQIHVFNLANWGSYPTLRDEVVSFTINSTTPVKLRLINNMAGNRYINLYRVDITSINSTSIKTIGEDKGTLKVTGRKITTEKPASINIYSLTGVSLISAYIENEYELPATLTKGIYILKNYDQITKILI